MMAESPLDGKYTLKYKDDMKVGKFIKGLSGIPDWILSEGLRDLRNGVCQASKNVKVFLWVWFSGVTALIVLNATAPNIDPVLMFVSLLFLYAAVPVRSLCPGVVSLEAALEIEYEILGELVRLQYLPDLSRGPDYVKRWCEGMLFTLAQDIESSETESAVRAEKLKSLDGQPRVFVNIGMFDANDMVACRLSLNSAEEVLRIRRNSFDEHYRVFSESGLVKKQKKMFFRLSRPAS
jgi:hypothetical protein